MNKPRYDSPLCRARDFILSHMDDVRASDSYQLLSERDLAQAASISRVTVRSALKELIRQGYIINLPKKGNFIDRSIDPPRHTVGIVRDDGVEAAYYADFADLLTNILEVLSEKRCAVKFVTSPNLSGKIPSLFSRNGLDGLLWISPPGSLYDEINEVGMSPDCPIVSFITSDVQNVPFSGNYVSMDYPNVGKARAEFFLEHGCHNVAYVGNSGITYESFRERFHLAGIEICPHCQIERINNISALLPELLAKKRVEAIVSNGARIRLEEVFQVMSDFPDRDEVLFLADWIPELPALMRRYPQVRVDAVGRKRLHNMESAVARMMSKTLSEHKLQAPLLVDFLCQPVGNNLN
jgi:DNA-binding LacI/PurR family transcriptional regulator